MPKQTLESFFDEIAHHLPKGEYRVFRGQSSDRHRLTPTLMRAFKKMNQNPEASHYESIWKFENHLYEHFRSLVGPRIHFASSWDTVFTMRHQGLPTRLLDWSENVGVALFFALNGERVDKPHIWILDPFKLNKKEKACTKGSLINPEEDDFFGTYYNIYASHCMNLRKKVPHRLPIALYPSRTNDRLMAQRGIFTIHGPDERPMETSVADCLTRIDIPPALVKKLKELVGYFGINHYSVYPDLKGLSEFIEREYGY